MKRKAPSLAICPKVTYSLFMLFMTHRHSYLYFTICLALFSGAIPFKSLAKTPLPEAPIWQFKLPLFGQDGYKRWDLEGREGHFSGNEGRLEVQGMRLRVFTTGASHQLEATLESPQATLFPKSRKAEGNEYLFLTTSQYTVVGHGWRWEEVNHDTLQPIYRVVLKSDVRVVFKDSLDRVFKQSKSLEL